MQVMQVMQALIVASDTSYAGNPSNTIIKVIQLKSVIARDANKASNAGKTCTSVTEPTFEFFVQDWYINCTKTIIHTGIQKFKIYTYV